MQISRIRLSDETSRLHPRHVAQVPIDKRTAAVLKEKGFTDAVLARLDAALKTAFDIKFVFNR